MGGASPSLLHRCSRFPKGCWSVFSLCFAAFVFTLGLGIASLRSPIGTDLGANLWTGILRTHFATTGPSSRLSSERGPKTVPSPPYRSAPRYAERRGVVDDRALSGTNESDTEGEKRNEVEGIRIVDSRTIEDEVLDKIDSRSIHEKPLEFDRKGMGSSRQQKKRHKNVSFHVTGHCNLFEGKWVADSQETLYKNYSCPILSQHQNCRGNGRPDKDYERWKWKPKGCKLPRFDVQAFFRIMKGKTLGFVGDSVARNQMESLMCILWQVEVPENRGFRKMQRWFFPDHSVTIIRIWSAWLVHASNEAFGFVPENITKLHLEVPDEKYMDFLSRLDILVLSAGHWFSKQTAYILKGEPVGGQLWADKRVRKKFQNPDAFAITMRTALRAITSNPGYKGLTILRTYSPDHYAGGAWDTGGSCTGKTRPLRDDEVAFNSYTDLMRRHQLEAFAEVEHNITNGSKLRLMDITPVFEHRADGHPGPYRSLDPNKITKRGPNGKPPPQDCLHWCLPGPIDTWNEFVLEIIRQQEESSLLLSSPQILL